MAVVDVGVEEVVAVEDEVVVVDDVVEDVEEAEAL